jgi:hypothetical protein
MQNNMLDNIMNPMKLGKEFFKTLDQKLHYLSNDYYCNIPVKYNSYYDKKISTTEYEKMLQILKNEPFLIHPINTNFGLSIGFNVININSKKSVLKFLEKQLPEGENFETLSEYLIQS